MADETYDGYKTTRLKAQTKADSSEKAKMNFGREETLKEPARGVDEVMFGEKL